MLTKTAFQPPEILRTFQPLREQARSHRFCVSRRIEAAPMDQNIGLSRTCRFPAEAGPTMRGDSIRRHQPILPRISSAHIPMGRALDDLRAAKGKYAAGVFHLHIVTLGAQRFDHLGIK